jgi:hypothetical protein
MQRLTILVFWTFSAATDPLYERMFTKFNVISKQ